MENKKRIEALNKLEQITERIVNTLGDFSNILEATSSKMRDLCIDVTALNVWLAQELKMARGEDE